MERTGDAPPPVTPHCKSLGAFEAEWIHEAEQRSPKPRQRRGGQSNHGVMLEPGQPWNPPRSKSWEGGQ
jgi:hypothetical protein